MQPCSYPKCIGWCSLWDDVKLLLDQELFIHNNKALRWLSFSIGWDNTVILSSHSVWLGDLVPTACACWLDDCFPSSFVWLHFIASCFLLAVHAYLATIGLYLSWLYHIPLLHLSYDEEWSSLISKSTCILCTSTNSSASLNHVYIELFHWVIRCGWCISRIIPLVLVPYISSISSIL